MSDGAPAGSIPLGPGGEFDAIRTMLARWGDRARGIGDDAAVLALPRGDHLVASVDASVEGVHFRAGWLAPREIGRRAATAALSDLAAMAARPLGVLVAIEASDAWRDALGDIADGIGDALADVGAPVIGGNMTRGPQLSLTITVLGHAHTALRRDGVRAGDRLYVTGRLGGPSAALEAWLAGTEPSPACRARFVAPSARIREARWLADAGATAGIDVSDGLVADLGHLAHASGVRIVLDAERVPRLEGLAIDAALRGGEEYELVVASPTALDTAEFERRFGVALTHIADARVAETPGVDVRLRTRRVAPPSGYDHYSG